MDVLIFVLDFLTRFDSRRGQSRAFFCHLAFHHRGKTEY